MPIIDVRDCAMQHLKAIEVPEAANNRFISNCESVWFKDIASTLKEKYPEGFKISQKDMSWVVVKIGSWFNDEAKRALQYWQRDLNLSHEKAEKLLGMTYRDVKETIKKTAEVMIEKGMIPSPVRK